ncbi:MAG: hypothetical protein GYA33_16365 [Thermogutta sp.]|nr:hypothetical protein [Thermogutta sp.]
MLCRGRAMEGRALSWLELDGHALSRPRSTLPAITYVNNTDAAEQIPMWRMNQPAGQGGW